MYQGTKTVLQKHQGNETEQYSLIIQTNKSDL